MQKYNTNHESGRSLIEVIGVLALGGILLAGTLKVYQVIRTRQARIVVTEDLRDIAQNSRLLFSGRNDYTGISVSHLIKMGALKTDRAPAIATEYNIQAEPDGQKFHINLLDVNFADCAWAATQRFDWADSVQVNDHMEGAPAENCKRDELNKVTIVVK